jgi:hypothetical protein
VKHRYLREFELGRLQPRAGTKQGGAERFVIAVSADFSSAMRPRIVPASV